MQQNILEQTLASGVSPLSLDYRAMVSTKDKSVAAYRTVLMINSLEMGALSPDEYRYVAGRSSLIVRLAQWNLKKAFSDIEAFLKDENEINWISVAVPTKMIIKDGFAEALGESAKKYGEEVLSKLCIEFSDDILYEDSLTVSKVLEALSKKGVKTMLRGFGGEFCPTLRISGLKFDYVTLDEALTRKEAPHEKLVSVLHLVKSRGSEPVFEGIKTPGEVLEASANAVGYCFTDFRTEEEKRLAQHILKGSEPQ